jgi:hypothetical protein
MGMMPDPAAPSLSFVRFELSGGGLSAVGIDPFDPLSFALIGVAGAVVYGYFGTKKINN